MSALCRARSPLQAAQYMIRLNMDAVMGAGAASDSILRAVGGGKRKSIHQGAVLGT